MTQTGEQRDNVNNNIHFKLSSGNYDLTKHIPKAYYIYNTKTNY